MRAGFLVFPGLCARGPNSGADEEMDLTFDFGSVRNGYAWIFPKGDHLNVGVYSQSSAAGLTRSRLLSYVKDRVGTDRVDHVTGQYLGIGAGVCDSDWIQPDLRDRVLLVGDAGGFVDPLTGEGIYGALLSGQAAASAILSEMRGEGAQWRNSQAISTAIARRCGFLPGRRRLFMRILPVDSARCACPSYAGAGQNLYPWTQCQEPGHAHCNVTVLRA